MDTEKIYRVFNRCKYDIGVRLSNGQEINIRAGSFQPMKTMDIQYVDSICRGPGFFTTKKLVAVGDDGKDVLFEQVGLYEDKSVSAHLKDEEIAAQLKKSAKQIENWLNEIEDPAELHAVYLVARSMEDLSASKIRVLSAKMPDKDWLSDE